MNSKSLLLRCALFSGALLFFSNYQAQVTVSWRTEAANGSWENGSNTCAEIGNVNSQWWYNGWGNNSARNKPDCFGSHILVFDNNHQLTMSLGSGSFNVHRLVFSSGNTSARTIGTVGNGTINFFEFSSTWPRIQNNSSAVHTINAAIIGSPNASFNLELVPSTQSLIFGGTINNNGKSIQVYGNNTAVDANNRFVQLNGIVSGSGPLNISQFGVVKLNASNSYTGQTQIDNGELWIELNGAISSSSAIFVGNGGQLANTAKLWLANSTGGVTFNNNVTINPGNSNTRFIGGLNSSGVNIFSGTITNNSDNGLNLVADLSGGTVEFNGVLAGSKPYFTSGLGTVVISGTSSNAYNTGLTTLGSAVTVLNKSANMIAITTNATLQSGKILRTDASNQWGTGTPPLLSILGNGIFNLNNFDQKVAISSSSATASITLGSATLTIDNSLTDTYAGTVSGTGGITKSSNGTLILSGTNTYSGNTIVNSGTLQLNKTGGGTLPNTNSITVNNGGTLRISSNQTLADLTINSGGTVIVDANVQLTITGTLTNNGTMTIESGATFLQGPSSIITSGTTGTYNVKQTVTGAGGVGSAPTGRFWYMGVPLNSLTRGAAFGSAGTDNRLWSWSELNQQWSLQITDNNEVLSPTTGYVFRTSAPSTTLNFSGTSLYSSNVSLTGLSNSGGTFAGCHLISNPYTAYLDWEQIVDVANSGTSNISTTYCVRSYNNSSNLMVYDYYNATGNASTSGSGLATTQFIAPLQSFWIKVNPTSTGSINFTKSMISHQSSGIGLKDITSFPAFARLNLVSGNFYDQVVIYTDADASSDVEDFDSRKFFIPNLPQVYCPVGNDKLVINGLKQGKAQTSAPLTVELPSTQVYKFEMAESFVENGLVILEDKQEGIFQDMGINPIYEFYGNSGVIADRFVLHFQLPNGTNNEGQAGVEDLTNGQIAVIANHDGAVTVALSSDLTTSGDIQIFDGAGRLVAQKAITSAQTSLQLNNGMGVYFVRVQTPMKSETKKVMVY